MEKKRISGFSKMSKRRKLLWIVENFFLDPETVLNELKSYWMPDEEKQRLLDGFCENTITNYHLPFSVAPNFVINGKTYAIPMVIEESSVVAAASSAAKYWMNRGGFHAEVEEMLKPGHIYFTYDGDREDISSRMPDITKLLISESRHLTESMENRNGGLRDIVFNDVESDQDLYAIKVLFDTVDSMGANFINSVLENMADSLETFAKKNFNNRLQILMAILSNHTPQCLARSWVSCPVSELTGNNMAPEEFATRMELAVKLAHADIYRATTHNKGIYNGIDAVVIATGNDFRAVEAAGHSYAARNGDYHSLSNCHIRNGHFYFELEVPLALGTVGGLTSLHPMAKRSLELLGNPQAKELMMIVATAGLAQNFAALRSLTTTGIQKGHMKMHLTNMLHQLQATEKEIEEIYNYFKDKVISYPEVRAYLQQIRQ